MKKYKPIIIMLVGIFITYSMYSFSESGDLSAYPLLIILLPAAGMCFLISKLIFKKIGNKYLNLLASLFLCYISNLIIMFSITILTSSFAETYMWHTIIIMFAIPFMFPLTLLTWVSVLLLNKGRTEPAPSL